MKSVVAWAIRQTPAMNTFMVTILLVGLVAGFMLRREEFPRFELEIITVTVPYPGASPEEVEQGICQKIEEAVRSVDGVKKLNSVAAEGSGSVIVEVSTDVPDIQKVLNEIESEVARIPSFPELSEEPNIRQLTIRDESILIGVTANADGDSSERAVRDQVERIRDELLALPSVNNVEIWGERDYQLDVEIPESTLRKHGLTLTAIADAIRRENLELPGGQLKGRSETFLLRGKNKGLTGAEIEGIPVVTKRNGVVLTVGDLGSVRDEFSDDPRISRLNGGPGYALSVTTAARDDLFNVTDEVKAYVTEKVMPAGYDILYFNDTSVDVRDRLDLLIRNGSQGLLLVFLVLALFLELRLAFWVALGIPIAVLGACGVLWQADQTLNMLSMFAFLIALGIVVDDAIVIGENIYAHRQLGKEFVQAAIDGTVEVFPSVATSITTTVFAFMPMFFVTGVMGKFFAVLPLAVIAMLIISLVESVFILPCHLAHKPNENSATWTQRAVFRRRTTKNPAVRWVSGPVVIVLAFVADQMLFPVRCLFAWSGPVNRFVAGMLDRFIQGVYLPTLKFCLQNPAMAGSLAVFLLLGTFSLVSNGTVKWIVFPELDARLIKARLVYPDGTPIAVTDEASEAIEEAIVRVSEKHSSGGVPLAAAVHRLVGRVSAGSVGGAGERIEGGHAATVTVQLTDSTLRSITSTEIVDLWREEAGEFPGVESLTFASEGGGPGGSPIEFRVVAPASEMAGLENVVEAAKAKLATFPGVYDIEDDSRPGKWELQLSVRDDAKSLGIPLQQIAGTVRSAYYGEEVMRLQRGRHEVKLMVRYPEEERRSLTRFAEIEVDAGDGIRRPITELVDVKLERGFSEINRQDQRRAIRVTADVDETVANAALVAASLRKDFFPGMLADNDGVDVIWGGQQEQTIESMQSLMIGLAIAMLATFVLLTLEFTSYLQPAIVMAIIPFGAIGAIWGHVFMGIPLTLFSILGMVALTGVVINDSIVLVDFINARQRAGQPLLQAVLDSGQRRFRPVLLTSLTTTAGLLPILTEKSFQAQLVIPMATSLCFGLMLGTALVLLLVPTLYVVYGFLSGMIAAEELRTWRLISPSDETEAAEILVGSETEPNESQPGEAGRQLIDDELPRTS